MISEAVQPILNAMPINEQRRTLAWLQEKLKEEQEVESPKSIQELKLEQSILKAMRK